MIGLGDEAQIYTVSQEVGGLAQGPSLLRSVSSMMSWVTVNRRSALKLQA